MAHSAGRNPRSSKVGHKDETTATQDKPRFWTKPSICPPDAIEQWKKEFTLVLFAKTMIRVRKFKHYIGRTSVGRDESRTGNRSRDENARRAKNDREQHNERCRAEEM